MRIAYSLALLFAVPCAAFADDNLDAKTRAALALAVAQQRPTQDVTAKSDCICVCIAADGTLRVCDDCKCESGQCSNPNCICLPPNPNVKRKACPCGCSCGGACQCTTPGACGDASCTCGTVAQRKPFTLNDAVAKAVAENKPLLVWVAEVCLPCERKMPNYVHVRVAEYDGYSGLVSAPCAILFKPDGAGSLDKVTTFPGIPTAEQVAAALRPPVQQTYAQPLMRPLMMPMMGGFGGGCAGGS